MRITPLNASWLYSVLIQGHHQFSVKYICCFPSSLSLKHNECCNGIVYAFFGSDWWSFGTQVNFSIFLLVVDIFTLAIDYRRLIWRDNRDQYLPDCQTLITAGDVRAFVVLFVQTDATFQLSNCCRQTEFDLIQFADGITCFHSCNNPEIQVHLKLIEQSSGPDGLVFALCDVGGRIQEIVLFLLFEIHSNAINEIMCCMRDTVILQTCVFFTVVMKRPSPGNAFRNVIRAVDIDTPQEWWLWGDDSKQLQ